VIIKFMTHTEDGPPTTTKLVGLGQEKNFMNLKKISKPVFPTVTIGGDDLKKI